MNGFFVKRDLRNEACVASSLPWSEDNQIILVKISTLTCCVMFEIYMQIMFDIHVFMCSYRRIYISVRMCELMDLISFLIHMYVYVQIYICAYIYTDQYLCTYDGNKHTHICIHTYLYMYAYICTHI